MLLAPLPLDETERLASLRACAILDTPPDPRFDAITRLAARLCDAPIALVSLVDEARLWFKSAHGCIQAGTEVGRGIAFCAHAILTPQQPFVIGDIAEDPRFADNPLATGELGLRAYAGMPLRDAAGRALGVLCVLDVTPRRFSSGEVETLCDLATAVSSMIELCRGAEALRESEEHYRCAVELNPQIPWTADRGGQMLEASQRMAALTGLDREDLAGMGWMEIVHPDDLAAVAQHWSRCVWSGALYDSEHRVRLAGGAYHWFRVRAAPRHGAGGVIVRWYGTAEDVTERRRSQAQVAHMAHHDALTGLANRVLFRERLDQQLAGVCGETRLAVLAVDLDNFKAVNDTLGHPVGDGLLQQVAGRLRDCIRETDTVARFGGDEFMIVQAGLVSTGEAAKLAQRIIDALGAPCHVDGHVLNGSASVGIALALDGDVRPDALIRDADLALYRAKAEGRGTFRLFDAAMDERVQTRSALKLDLHGALARREFELVYQPIVNLRSGRVTCFEALLRWRHPQKDTISPAEFIPMAEEIGAVGPICEWVLEQACRQAASWPGGIGVAVNLSPVQFRDRDLPERIAAVLVRTSLAPGRLELEITESVLLLDDDANVTILRKLRDLGIRIAMDDFGTGYSSLSYLNRFPFDKLKIDRSFVNQLSEAAEACAIVRAVVGLSRALRIVTTAEGVETPQQLDWLRAEGCDQAQGYLFSRPVSPGDVPALIRTLQAAEPTWP